MLLRLLLAVEQPGLRRRLQRLLAKEDVDIETVAGGNPRWDDFIRRNADALLVSQSLIPRPAEQHITDVGALPNSPGVVVLTDREDLELQAKYQAAGAEAVLYQELPNDLLKEALSTVLALRTELLTKQIAARRAVARPQLSDFVSSSSAMEIFLRTAYQVADSDVPLLILGETGVGKERLARAIHGESRRSAGPFISVNCGAVPEQLIEKRTLWTRSRGLHGRHPL